jgi:Right handed beta helix region
MKRVSLQLAAGIVVCLLVATSASAQVARVFLAGTGNDANDCTNQATPCRSLQGAVTACPINGEIIVLDNGGYGSATINKSLTVNASAGVVAFIARTITVNIASTDKVVLRGLSMNGVVFGDQIGIWFTGGGTLVVENSVIAGFGSGIYQVAAGSNLIVNNCEFRNNRFFGVLNGTAGDTNSNTLIENSRFEYNGYVGVRAGIGTANVSIRNSALTNNTTGVLALGSSQTQPVLIVVDTCTIAHNSEGMHADSGVGMGSATIRVTNSTIYHNVDGMVVLGLGGAIQSYGNNRVTANTNNSTFSGTVLPLQ